MSAAGRDRSPCTLYKAADIARARENIARYPWAKTLYAGTRRQAERYLSMDRERLRSFISKQTPLVTVVCPNCGCGPWYAYTLSDDGDTIHCNDCGAGWAWDPDDSSETWNIQAVLRSYRLKFILGGLESTGIAYRIDGDRRFAEAAAVLVGRFAEVFAGYRMNRVNQNDWLEGNDPYYGKIDGWKRRDGGALRGVLLAYDLIRDSGVLTPAQCARIDRELVQYTRDYFVEGYHQPGIRTLAGFGEKAHLSPYLAHYSIQDQGEAWWCIAASAALLGDKATLRSLVALYEAMLEPANGVFHADGTFYECTPTYQTGLLRATLGIPEILRGNLDEDVFTNPRCALLRRCYTWYLDAVFPDGTVPALNDAHVGDHPPPFAAEVAFIRYGDRRALRHLKERWGAELNGGTEYSLFYREPAAAQAADEAYGRQSVHLPGIGLMVLRDDREASARTMAFLDYGPYVPAAHKHRDYLNLGLWSAGTEMLSEMGYNWNPEWARFWGRGPLSHNSVREVVEQGERGQPLLWCVTPGPRLAEAGLPPGNQRFLALLPRAQAPPLIVEIFRVAGEAPAFTWMMHARSSTVELRGVAAWSAATDLPEPLRDGRRGTAAADVTATWTFGGEDGAPVTGGLAVKLPSGVPSTITLSHCPPEEDVIQALHSKGGTLKEGAVLPYRGHLQVSRPGPRTVFTAIYAPFAGTTAPAFTVTQPPVVGPPGAVALQIDVGAERFLVLHLPEPGRARCGEMELEGRAAVATLRDGALQSLCLGDGTAASYGAARLARQEAGNAYGEQRGEEFGAKELEKV